MPPVVRLSQALDDLLRDRDRAFGLQRSAPDQVLERVAVVVCHRDEQVAVFCFVDLVDRANVGVIQGGCGLRLLYEAGLGRGIAGEFGREKFQGHDPVETGVLGLVDLAHSSLADLGEDLVVGYGTAC